METLVLGVLMAVTLFWAIGAHNRLVRLRSEVIRQWGSVDAVWLRLLVRMQGGLVARLSQYDPVGADDLQDLQKASDDLLDALSQVRLQPLDAVSQKLVAAQHQKLVAEIRRILQTSSETVKPDLDIALSRMRQTLPAALIPYHVAVAAYNDALSMRPASWLAKRLKLQAASRVDLSMGVS